MVTPGPEAGEAASLEARPLTRPLSIPIRIEPPRRGFRLPRWPTRSPAWLTLILPLLAAVAGGVVAGYLPLLTLAAFVGGSFMVAMMVRLDWAIMLVVAAAAFDDYLLAVDPRLTKGLAALLVGVLAAAPVRRTAPPAPVQPGDDERPGLRGRPARRHCVAQQRLGRAGRRHPLRRVPGRPGGHRRCAARQDHHAHGRGTGLRPRLDRGRARRTGELRPRCGPPGGRTDRRPGRLRVLPHHRGAVRPRAAPHRTQSSADLALRPLGPHRAGGDRRDLLARRDARCDRHGGLRVGGPDGAPARGHRHRPRARYGALVHRRGLPGPGQREPPAEGVRRRAERRRAPPAVAGGGRHDPREPRPGARTRLVRAVPPRLRRGDACRHQPPVGRRAQHLPRGLQ